MIFIYCENHAKHLSGSTLCGKMQRLLMFKQMALYHCPSHWTRVHQYELQYTRFDHMDYFLSEVQFIKIAP